MADAAGSTVADEIVTNSGTGPATLHTGSNNTSTTFSGVVQNGSTTATTALDKTGAGTFTLRGANTYTGGTTLSGGTLELGSQGAAGTTASGSQTAGGVAFRLMGTTLQIDNAALNSNRYAAPVTNFASGETIDLSGLAYIGSGATTASYNPATTTLSVTDGATTDTLTDVTLGSGLTAGFYTLATSQDTNSTNGTDVTLSLNAPSAPVLATGQDTGTSSTDRLTDIDTPTVTGTGADPNSTITLYDGDGTTAIGAGTSDANGNYTATVTTALADGTHNIDATVTDAGNDVSARSTATSITVDTSAPTITTVSDSGTGIDANGNGDLGAGKTVTLTVTTSETVYVTAAANGAVPTVTFNDGGVATYTGGSGTTSLTFTYTVAAGQNTADLAVRDIQGNKSSVTDAAGNPIDLTSLATATKPSGTLVVDTTPPVASSVTDTVAQNAGPTPVGIAAPSDNLTAAGSLAIAAGALPTDGLVTLANGMAVTTGQALTSAQLTGLLFTPTGVAGQSSAFTYTVTDGAGNASQGTATLNVGAPNTPPTPTPTPVAPDAVSISPQVTYNGSAFAITGTASSAAGVRAVEISAVVDGVATDLGAATVNTDGTFVFSDPIGASTQGFITATETDAAGGTASAQANYSLTGGLDTADGSRAPFVAEQDVYSADGSATTSVSLFRGDGSASNDASRRTTIMAAGQTFTSDQFDDFKNGGTPETTFVFNPNHGLDTISLFRVDGADHDTLNFKGSDFGNSIANVLRDTRQTSGGSSIIVDPTTGDTVKLVGITKQQLAQNQGDIAFHA